MDITSITSARGTNFNNEEVITAEKGKSTLDVNDFLKLISVQLTTQDPMKPMEDTQFISQMANFTSLQQMRDLTANMKDFTAVQKINTAQDYLGKTVTIVNADGTATGPVSEIKVIEGEPKLIINGKTYDPSNVTSIVSTVPSTTKSEQPMLGTGPSAQPATN